MKKYIGLILVVITTAYSVYYASLGGFKGNGGALSKIGLTHPLLFALWGALTFITLTYLLLLSYSEIKYSFYKYLIALSLAGMLMTVLFDFDYDEKLQYYIHCTGSLMFSVVTSINVFSLFMISKRYVLSCICAVIVTADFILLLIFKETAFIELFPVFTGYVLLLINDFTKRRYAVEAQSFAQRK